MKMHQGINATPTEVHGKIPIDSNSVGSFANGHVGDTAVLKFREGMSFKHLSLHTVP